MNANNTLLITGVIGTGLVAGLLYGWAVSVIPGTTRVGDHTYVETMQDINRAIINPAFIIPFMGVPLALGAASICTSGPATPGEAGCWPAPPGPILSVSSA